MITKYDQSRWEKAESYMHGNRSEALIRRVDSKVMGWIEPYRGGGVNNAKGFWLTVANTPPFFQREDGVVEINYTQRCETKIQAKRKIHRIFERTEENEDHRYELDKRGQIPSHWRHRHVRASGGEQVEDKG